MSVKDLTLKEITEICKATMPELYNHPEAKGCGDICRIDKVCDYIYLKRVLPCQLEDIWVNEVEEEMTSRHCSGCEDNFYNRDGQSCWCFECAKLEKRKRVSVNDRPPWDWPAGIYPSCYKQKGYVFVNPKVTK